MLGGHWLSYFFAFCPLPQYQGTKQFFSLYRPRYQNRYSYEYFAPDKPASQALVTDTDLWHRPIHYFLCARWRPSEIRAKAKCRGRTNDREQGERERGRWDTGARKTKPEPQRERRPERNVVLPDEYFCFLPLQILLLSWIILIDPVWNGTGNLDWFITLRLEIEILRFVLLLLVCVLYFSPERTPNKCTSVRYGWVSLPNLSYGLTQLFFPSEDPTARSLSLVFSPRHKKRSLERKGVRLS